MDNNQVQPSDAQAPVQDNTAPVQDNTSPTQDNDVATQDGNNQVQDNAASEQENFGQAQDDSSDAQNDNTSQEQTLTEEDLDNLSEEQLIDLYVAQLMMDKDLGDLDDDVKAEIHNDLKERVLFQVNRAVIAALPDAELDELNQAIDNNTLSPEKMSEIVKKAGINTDEIVQKTMLEFRDIYLNGTVGQQTE